MWNWLFHPFPTHASSCLCVGFLVWFHQIYLTWFLRDRRQVVKNLFARILRQLCLEGGESSESTKHHSQQCVKFFLCETKNEVKSCKRDNEEPLYDIVQLQHSTSQNLSRKKSQTSFCAWRKAVWTDRATKWKLVFGFICKREFPRVFSFEGRDLSSRNVCKVYRKGRQVSRESPKETGRESDSPLRKTNREEKV